MLYDQLHVITKEFKGQVCEVLYAKGIAEKDVCLNIIDLFLNTERHLSVADFDLLLKAEDIHLDTVAIETVLDILTEFGFAQVRKFEGEQVNRYEHLHPNDHHDHFVCIKCKKIMEFSNDQLEKMQDSLIFHKGYKPLFHKLEVYGLCDNCVGTAKEPMPINFAKEESIVKLCKIESGWSLRKRLAELGFVENEPIRVIKNSNFGPIVLEVKGSRIALGQSEARKILVYDS